MRKEGILLFVIPLVMLFLGLFSGFYFGIYRTSLAVTACEISKALIPASPVVTSSVYNPKTNQLALTIQNPGGMPIELLSKTLVLQPQGNTQAPVALAVQIPLGLVVPPYSNVTLKLDLTQKGSGFKLGDVLVSTITYRLPISNDIYSLVHLFKHSGKTNAQGNVVNAYGDNSELEAKYKNSLKTSNKVQITKENANNSSK